MRTPYRKPGKYTNMKIDPLLTEDKIVALENKLKRLKEQRPKLAALVAEFAQMGDFSENAEYQHAKWQLRRLNRSIEVTKNRLDHAVLIEKPKQYDSIDLLHNVTVLVNGKEKKLQIVGPSETNPQKGKISNSSPVGKALLGRKLGDVITIILANKKVEYTITNIE